MRRFWRSVGFVRRQGSVFVGEAPFLHRADVLYAFGNVSYHSGARVSSRLLRKPVAEIAGAQPTLSRELLIDSMESPRDWNWVPAYTDPNLENGRFFTPWHSGNGAKGFSLDPAMFSYQAPMSYYFGTRKIGDPQFRGRGQAALWLDCLADRVPEKLTVRVTWRLPGTYGEECEAIAPLPRSAAARPTKGVQGQGAWVTLQVERQNVRKKDGTPLPDWEHAEYFILVGTNPAGKPPVFKNLRWSQ
jgi:hypothetical protein